jgi:hypothetical protein
MDMITKKQYVEYLVSTPKNCTCTYLAEHLEDVSHDVVNDFLHQKRFLPRASRSRGGGRSRPCRGEKTQRSQWAYVVKIARKIINLEEFGHVDFVCSLPYEVCFLPLISPTS